MQNHSDSFQPPGEQQSLGDAKAMFQFISGVFLIAVHILAVFYSLIVKKPGTVGTRAYWFDMMCGITLLIALSQNSWYPDRYMFQASIVILVFLYLRHLTVTLNKKVHVHTKCVGSSRFGSGDRGHLMEFMFGGVGGLLICLTGCVPYGVFIIGSTIANAIRDGMIEERDRQRSVQMADAMAEQEYMMDRYEQFQRERLNQ